MPKGYWLNWPFVLMGSSILIPASTSLLLCMDGLNVISSIKPAVFMVVCCIWVPRATLHVIDESFTSNIVSCLGWEGLFLLDGGSAAANLI